MIDDFLDVDLDIVIWDLNENIVKFEISVDYSFSVGSFEAFETFADLKKDSENCVDF